MVENACYLATPAPLPCMSRTQMNERQQRLAEIAVQLKTELFGIDEIIDQVIENLRVWYILPHCMTRPVVICLWGLTGTGKTQLVRRLAQLLGFYDRFVEVQMGGAKRRHFYTPSIADTLSESNIDEALPGILLLDEFQHFRTITSDGQEISTDGYEDVWTLLSDGRLPPSPLKDVDMQWADTFYDEERDAECGSLRSDPATLRFRISARDADQLKRLLKLRESLTDIMQWSWKQVQQRFSQFRSSPQHWETDYSRLLIFICGNLDEMYQETAQRVEDCDTDADIFRHVTSNLSLIDVKKSLSQRFRPEQTARLGNLHIIYPSLSRRTYERLIAEICQRYVDDVEKQTGVRFAIGADVHAALYANAVFPAQGARPLFSSAHAILSGTLLNAALWALEQNLDLTHGCVLELSEDRQCLSVSGVNAQGACQRAQFAAAFDLDRIKTRTNKDFRALLAVHEAGHALIYSLLFKQPPQEVRINIASFEGGYSNFVNLKASTRQNELDMICVSLAGRAAEEWVFGHWACTTGAQDDYQQATSRAARYVRHHGFGEHLSHTDITMHRDEHINTNIAPSNEEIETLLRDQYVRAQTLLRVRVAGFKAVVNALLRCGSITPPEMVALMQNSGIETAASTLDAVGLEGAVVLESFAEHWAAFCVNHADACLSSLGKVLP